MGSFKLENGEITGDCFALVELFADDFWCVYSTHEVIFPYLQFLDGLINSVFING